MDSLLEGEKYNLSNDEENKSNKTVIFMKLTDSFSKSIDDLMKNTGYSNPKIEFNEHGGVINFYTENGIQKYSFSLSDLAGKENEDMNNIPNRSFECVQQNRNRSLESLGCMSMKMQIRAKEDSYENTRFKVAAAEKEQKQFCAKEIKPAGSHLGHQVKVSLPKNISVPSNSCSALSAKSIETVRPKNNIDHPFNSASIPSAKHDSNRSVKPTSIPSAIHDSNRSVKPTSIPSAIYNSNTSAKPTSIPSTSRGSSPFQNLKKENSKPRIPSGIQRQPLRDRIIHLLALRPFKKPEILVKLIQEGVNEKDKNSLTRVLSQVSTLKKNSFYLSDGFWREVQDNWKFYSPEDAETVRKNKQQYLQSRSSSDIQSGSSQKNHLAKENGTNFYLPSTKQRISHVKGFSSQELKRHVNPENAVKSPSFSNAPSQMHQIRRCKEMSNKDNKINAINPVSQSAALFSSEYSRKSTDRNSTGESSGYGSKSSSESSEEFLVDKSTKKAHRYFTLSSFEGYIHDQKLKMDNVSKVERKEGSSLSSAVPSSSQGSSKKDSGKRTAFEAFGEELNTKISTQNHPISSNTEYEMEIDCQNSSVLPSNIGLDRDSSAGSVKPSGMILEYGKKEDLKLVLTNTGSQGFKIKSKKAEKTPRESFQPTHKNDDQISPAESSKRFQESLAAVSTSSAESTKTLKKSLNTVPTSTMDSSMKHKHSALKIQPSEPSSCLTEPCSLSSNRDGVSHQASCAVKSTTECIASCATKSGTECITNDVIHPVTSGIEMYREDLKRQFVKIMSIEQRLKYQAVFNDELTKYNNVYKDVKEIIEYFGDLGELLRECPKESKEYQELEKVFNRDYAAANSFEFKKKYEDCYFAFAKLEYINLLVEEYDKEQLGKQ